MTLTLLPGLMIYALYPVTDSEHQTQRLWVSIETCPFDAYDPAGHEPIPLWVTWHC